MVGAQSRFFFRLLASSRIRRRERERERERKRGRNGKVLIYLYALLITNGCLGCRLQRAEVK